MASEGVGRCAGQLLNELDELHWMGVILLTNTELELRLRDVARAEKELAQLLAHLVLTPPGRPKIVSYVVPRIVTRKL